MPLNPVVIWFLAGLVLVIIEFMIPGVILVFFGAGAWITALCTQFGLTPGISAQLLVFAISSVLLLVFLRQRFRNGFLGRVSKIGMATDNIDDEIGGKVKVLEDLKPGTKGRVEFKGATWQAKSDTPLAAGSTAIITAHDSITLIIKSE